MNKLTYVTSNHGKYISIKEKFLKNKIDIDFLNYDLYEPEINDINIVSKTKALEAYAILNSPCFVIDSGFYIDNYPNNPGYPGAFVKRSGISSNIENLLEVMKNVENRSCAFVDCLTFYDGNVFYQFNASVNGRLSNTIKGDNMKNAKSNLWYVFIPDECTKTLAEMTDQELEHHKEAQKNASTLFIEWLTNEYSPPKKLVNKHN